MHKCMRLMFHTLPGYIIPSALILKSTHTPKSQPFHHLSLFFSMGVQCANFGNSIGTSGSFSEMLCLMCELRELHTGVLRYQGGSGFGSQRYGCLQYLLSLTLRQLTNNNTKLIFRTTNTEGNANSILIQQEPLPPRPEEGDSVQAFHLLSKRLQLDTARCKTVKNTQIT